MAYYFMVESKKGKQVPIEISNSKYFQEFTHKKYTIKVKCSLITTIDFCFSFVSREMPLETKETLTIKHLTACNI